MKKHPIFGSILLIIAVGLCSCDPVISVHQITVQSSVSPKLAIRSETLTIFWGEHSYAPRLTLFNGSASSIELGSVELATKRFTYKNAFPAVNPSSIAPGETKFLGTYFKLNETIEKSFKEPAELTIRYRCGGNDELATLRLVGGRFDER